MRYLKIGAAALAGIGAGRSDRGDRSRSVESAADAGSATLIAQAARYHARIQRDHFGVPHISGPTDPDVAFGLAFRPFARTISPPSRARR